MPAKLDLAAPLATSEDRLMEQVERILRSNLFQGSEILRNLLSYLADCAVANRSEPVKVKEIATAVFRRSADFDSQNDSVVRVHTGRLRSKLAEYYMGEGIEDDLIVTIPKGSYTLSWHPRQGAAPSTPELSEGSPHIIAHPVDPEASARHGASRLTTALLLIIIAGLAALCINAYLSARSVRPRVPPSLRTFWRPFTAEGMPLMVFSHLNFVETPDGNVRFRKPADIGKNLIDTYTTTGEVMGVYNLTKTFALFEKPTRVKTGPLLTWDDAEDSNLIFVGGPLAATPLRDVSVLSDFQFRDGDSIERHAIVNVHPRNGEPGRFPGPVERPFTFDYAVIAMRPAFSRSHLALALAGITEYGTWGASDFVTREESLKELLSRLGVRAGQPVPPFEAVLKIQIQGGVPVSSEIELVHQFH